MKKQLLCTSAIALGVAAAPAAAQDWNLDWGGFFNAHVAFVDAGGPGQANNAADYDGVAFLNTGEIFFTPSITLDNGLTFGVNVQLEAQNSGEGGVGGSVANNEIDESFITVSSDTFGLLVIGAENSAGYLLSTGASGVTSMSVNSPSISGFIPISTVGPGGPGLTRTSYASSFTEVARNNDVNRITYYTPDFNGLTIGVSYARNNNGNAGAPAAFQNTIVNDNITASVEDIFDIGVNYSGSFGTTDVVLSARYGTGELVAGTGASDPEVWGVGANVTFGEFGVAASYGEDTNTNASNGAANQRDTEGWSLGFYYDPAGPWTFSLTTYQGEFDIQGVDQTSYENYALMARRNLGPGVNWDIYLINVNADDETLTANDDLDGTIFGTGIALSF